MVDFDHAYDDRINVANSVLLFIELKKAGVPAELHAYATKRRNLERIGPIVLSMRGQTHGSGCRNVLAESPFKRPLFRSPENERNGTYPLSPKRRFKQAESLLASRLVINVGFRQIGPTVHPGEFLRSQRAYVGALSHVVSVMSLGRDCHPAASRQQISG